MLFRLSQFAASAVLLGLSGYPVALAAEEEKAAEPVVIRTEEDLVRGRENVRNVIGELSALFAADAPVPDLRKLARPIQPPYSRIVKGVDGRATLIFRPRFTTVTQMFKALDGVISGNALTEAVKEQNLLLVNAPDNEIGSYDEILTGMDVPSSQILIEAKVVEVVFNDGMQRNLSLGYSGNRGSVGAVTEVPGASPQPSTGLGGDWTAVSGSNNFNIAFQWLLTAQDAKVLSSPNILISRNETSRIVTGQDLPIQEANSTGNNLQMSTTFKRVGVTLEVEPSMINADNVTLRVYPQVSNVIRYESVAAGQGVTYPVPVISVRSVETHLRMQDKQVVMMGGLYNSSNTLQQQRVPILSDLPLVGELFTGKNMSTEVTQLIFFLKIHIISPEDASSGLFYNPDKSAQVSEKLGDIVENFDSFPPRKTSVENLKEELFETLPGRQEEKRRQIREEGFRLEPAGETVPKPAAETAPEPAGETVPEPAAETAPEPAAKPAPEGQVTETRVEEPAK